MNNRKTIYIILTIVFTVGFFIYDNYSVEDLKSIGKGSHKLSGVDYLPVSTNGQIVRHRYYTLSYNEKFEQAEWVAYELNSEHISNTNYERPFFERDLKVASRSADYKNYKNSGYDKGHLCPAGDRKFSKMAHDETFLTSNITPQEHQFNAGIWNRLEQKTRYWAIKYKKLYVITGGILSDDLKTIGQEEVAVPNFFYKIILDYQAPEIKVIAFLIPHNNSEKSLYNFVTSIDEIEALTQIDFFPKIEDTLENQLEAKSNYINWNF